METKLAVERRGRTHPRGQLLRSYVRHPTPWPCPLLPWQDPRPVARSLPQDQAVWQQLRASLQDE